MSLGCYEELCGRVTGSEPPFAAGFVSRLFLGDCDEVLIAAGSKPAVIDHHHSRVVTPAGCVDELNTAGS